MEKKKKKQLTVDINKPVLYFVYGTLKVQYGNHRVLGNNPEFKGEFSTKEIYTLFDGGFPVVERGGETSIKGELYLVSDKEDILNVFSLEGSTPIQGSSENWYDWDFCETPAGKAIIFVMNEGASGRKDVLESGEWL